MIRSITICTILLQSLITHCQSINDLDFLIGTWNLHEVTYPGTPGEYIETGKRQCEYAVLGSYIKCETTAIRHGKERTYVFLINYLGEPGKFQMAAMFSDYPQQGKHMLFLNKDKKEIQIAAMPGDFKSESFTRSTMSFSDKDKVVWEGWTSLFKTQVEWKLLYQETASRVK